MSDGEKMIWAAVFAKENTPSKGIDYAIEKATDTILELREMADQVKEQFGESSEVVKMYRCMLYDYERC